MSNVNPYCSLLVSILSPLGSLHSNPWRRLASVRWTVVSASAIPGHCRRSKRHCLEVPAPDVQIRAKESLGPEEQRIVTPGGRVSGDGIGVDEHRRRRGATKAPVPESSSDQAQGVAMAAEEEVVSKVVEWPEDGGLTREWVIGVGETLAEAASMLRPQALRQVVPVGVADSLIARASKIMHKEPNCLRLEPPRSSSSSIVLVGDLHGQLHDLLHLFDLAGLPDEERMFGTKYLLTIEAMKIEHAPQI